MMLLKWKKHRTLKAGGGLCGLLRKGILFLMLSCLLFVCGCEEPTITEEGYFFRVAQNNEEVKIINKEVTLERKPFEFIVGFQEECEIFVYGSFADTAYNKVKQGATYKEISRNGGGSVAVYDDDTELIILKRVPEYSKEFDIPVFYYLCYTDRASRFTTVIEKEDYLIGRKTFDAVSMLDYDSGHKTVPIEAFDRDEVFLIFAYENLEAVDCLKINFI